MSRTQNERQDLELDDYNILTEKALLKTSKPRPKSGKRGIPLL